MLRDEYVRIDIGRCVGGSFIRVTHRPTGLVRLRGPIDDIPVQVVEARFLAEIEQELAERGLTQYILPAHRVRGLRRDA